MFDRVGVGIYVTTIPQKVPPILHQIYLLIPSQLLPTLGTLVLQGVLGNLSRIKVLVGHVEDIRVILLMGLNELSEVYWSSDRQGIPEINSHTIEIPEVNESLKVWYSWCISEEAHSLQPPESECLIGPSNHLISQKLVENGSQNVHSCIFPETSFLIENLMPHQISHNSQFAKRTVFFKSHEVHNYFVGSGEHLFSYVLFSPQFQFIVRVNPLGLLIKVLLGWGQLLGSQPDLMDHLGNHSWHLLRPIFYTLKFGAIIQNNYLLERYPPKYDVLKCELEVLTLKTSLGLYKLMPINWVPSAAPETEIGVNENCFPWNIPEVIILFDEIQLVSLSYGSSDHLEKGHQKDQPIIKILPIDVPEIKLRNVPETFNSKYPHMINN